ncbi:MAG TPA: hypothetical protein VKF17_16185, partial [Isosphaeraceae bacterium]|nr:hypothetical protein [Isosphaeraceae bacterium]
QVRFVTAAPEADPVASVGPLEGAVVVPAQPRLEDGFMILLRGTAAAGQALAGSTTLDRPPERYGGEVVIEVRDLVRRFGSFTAVDHVSFEVRPGEIFGLLAVLKDPRGRFSLLVPPVFQCLLYGYVATYDLNDVLYAVLDRDRSAASRDLMTRTISRIEAAGSTAQCLSLFLFRSIFRLLLLLDRTRSRCSDECAFKLARGGTATRSLE